MPGWLIGILIAAIFLTPFVYAIFAYYKQHGSWPW